MDFKRGKGVVAEARLVILNVYSYFCGERDDSERLYILNDYSSVQYNVRRDELASFPSNSLSKARAIFKMMLTVRAKLKKSDYISELKCIPRVQPTSYNTAITEAETPYRASKKDRHRTNLDDCYSGNKSLETYHMEVSF